MKPDTAKRRPANPPDNRLTLQPDSAVGRPVGDVAYMRIIVAEYLGNYYVCAPSKEVIAMTPIRMVADLIADALNTSKKRTAVLLRQGWTVGRDGQLFPPNPTCQAADRKNGG